MGLQIGEIVPRKEISLDELKGKVIAVDAFNALYQFLANIRQLDGSPLTDNQGRITSHLSGLFYRTTNLMAKGLKLVYVFDGISPELKGKTKELREGRKEDAEIKYEHAKAFGTADEMLKYAKQTIRLNDGMIKESKELLDALGLPVIQAPSEGESQCAFIVRQNDAFAVASQDYDSLLFGATRVIQNLTLSRKRKTFRGFIPVMPEMIELENVFNSLQLNIEQLICLGILVGTDFNVGGVKSIGPKRAIQLVKMYKQPALIFDAVSRMAKDGKIPEPEFDWKDIFEIFRKPDVTKEYEIKFRDIDTKKVKELLCKEHDFSEERVDNAVERITKQKTSASQKDLKKWF